MNFIYFVKSMFIKKKIYNLKDVFTPASSAKISYIERKEVEKQLSKAIDVPGKQVVIYGHSGSGKTTVLNHVLNAKSVKKIVSRCTTNSTIDSIILDAFDELNPYYVESINNGKKDTVTGEISTEYLGIKSAINGANEISMSETKKRALPPQLTMQRLSYFIGEANAIWIIEDFHKVEVSEKEKISQMMKLFMDMATKYPNTKIIVLGAADNGYEVVAYDKELNNRVAEIEVPLLIEPEIKKILEKGATALNINYDTIVISQVANYSNCLATIAHQLAYNLCYNHNITKTQKKEIVIQENELGQAINDFTNEKQDTYKNQYRIITQQREGKYKNVDIILKALCDIGKKDVTQHDLFYEILKKYPEYPQGNLSTYLKKLTAIEGEEVLRNNSGRINFSDPFFESYVKMLDLKNES